MLRSLAKASADFARLPELQGVRTGMQQSMRHPRQLPRYSGRTAMQAHLHVHEDQQPGVNESPLAFSMEGLPLQKDASLLSAAWAPGWNSNQAISKFQQEINGELRQGCKGVHLLARDRRAPASESLTPDTNVPARPEVYFIEHLFGGEEVSATSPAIAARAVGPYVCVSAADAQRLGLRQHGSARIEAGSQHAEVGVLIRKRIAPGCVGLYCAGELSRAAFAEGFAISAVDEGNVLASSRAMFATLVVNDSEPGEG
jgi:NADH-quinone oxidoreductase subunit G